MHNLYDSDNLAKMLTSNQHQDSPPESRMDKMRKFLSSPLTRKKAGSQSKTFGATLETLAQRAPSEHSIPFVMTRLCQYILKFGLAHEGLFRISGNARSVERLRTSFDRTGDAPLETDGDVPSAAALLKLFLRELPDPVVPPALHREFLAAVKDKERTESVQCLAVMVEKLPPVNYNVLSYLFSFLWKVSQMEDQNRMSASSLGIVFGPNLFRVTEDFVGLKEQSLTNQIVTYFITDYQDIFKRDLDILACRTCFTLEMGKTKPVSAMVSSWPEAKGNTSSMLSTWSLGPLSSRNEYSKDFCAFSVQTSSDSYISFKYNGKNPVDVSLPNKDNHSDHPSFVNDHHPHENNVDGSFAFMDRRSSTPHSKDSRLKDYCIMDEEPILSRSSLKDSIPSIAVQAATPLETNGGYRISPENTNSLAKMFHEELKLVEEAGEMTDTHKMYPRGRRRYNKHRKTKSSGEDRPVRSEPISPEHFRDEDLFNGNPADSLSLCEDDFDEAVISEENGIDIRHSWPAFRKCREEEDIALSPLPQQLGTTVSEEASISPSAYRSYLHHRNIHLDPNLPPSPPVEQEDLITGVLDPAASNNVKQLYKKIHALKKKLKLFEENFEKVYGCKPSHTDKCNNITVKRILAELNKAKQDIKQYKDDPVSWDADDLIEMKSSRGTNTRCSQGLFSTSSTTGHGTFEDTVRDSLNYLSKNRMDGKRPDSLEEMTKEQLQAEKVVIQKILLNLESVHGRPSSKVQRELVRPLYDRYRITKRLIARCSTSKDNPDLMPILEHETMDFGQSEQDKSASMEYQKFDLSQTDSGIGQKSEKSVDSDSSSEYHINFHELSPAQLEAELNMVKEDKRKTRKVLRDFEERFKSEHGRKVQKEDKMEMQSTYTEYKNAKAKLKLLEALVAKHEVSI